MLKFFLEFFFACQVPLLESNILFFLIEVFLQSIIRLARLIKNIFDFNFGWVKLETLFLTLNACNRLLFSLSLTLSLSLSHTLTHSHTHTLRHSHTHTHTHSHTHTLTLTHYISLTRISQKMLIVYYIIDNIF